MSLTILKYFWSWLLCIQIEKAIKALNDDKDKDADTNHDKGQDNNKGTGKSQSWQILNFPVWDYSTDPLDWFTEFDDRLKTNLLLVTSWKVSNF